MLMQTPVVAFDVGGVKDAIPNQELGIVVPQGDTEKMADEVISLIADKNRLRMMGKKARLFVQENFPMQKMIDQVDHYMNELIDKRNSR